jgi:hypothetical protein
MNTKIFLLAALALSITLYSCKKDSDITEAAKPLVQKTTLEDNSYFLYQYDGNRLTKITSSDGGYTTIDYTATTATVKEYSVDNVLGSSQVFTLNSKGYAISSVTSSGKKKSLSTKSILPIAIAQFAIASPTTTYEYNSDGYMTKAIYGDAGNQEIITYTITNGNSVAYSDAAGGQTFTSTSQFYLDKTNTIGFENMGISFFGKQDKNLKQSVTDTYSGSAVAHSYTYQYDSQNRVASNTISTAGAYTTSTAYTYK